jgi:hypothetical protein
LLSDGGVGAALRPASDAAVPVGDRERPCGLYFFFFFLSFFFLPM